MLYKQLLIFFVGSIMFEQNDIQALNTMVESLSEELARCKCEIVEQNEKIGRLEQQLFDQSMTIVELRNMLLEFNKHFAIMASLQEQFPSMKPQQPGKQGGQQPGKQGGQQPGKQGGQQPGKQGGQQPGKQGGQQPGKKPKSYKQYYNPNKSVRPPPAIEMMDEEDFC